MRPVEVAFYDAIRKEYPDGKTEISRSEVMELVQKRKLKFPGWLVTDPERLTSRGTYRLDTFDSYDESDTPVTTMSQILKFSPPVEEKPVIDVAIPPMVEGYVPFGDYADILQIVKSRVFYPTYITGLSGNGKTMMVRQACAEAGREYIRVNVTIETDEDDLIGGLRLINGETVWQDGPVIVAMKKGAVLLLDEIDLGSNKLMCLQPILEGDGIFLKKTGEYVKHARGFNVIATANTKGQGSNDGKYIGTNVLNEAFLERFSITFEQDFPPSDLEMAILFNVLEVNNVPVTESEVRTLVAWANVTRATYKEGTHTELISTRRLVHICEAMAIFKNMSKAISLCLNRFDEATKSGFIDMYKAMKDAGPEEDSNDLNFKVLDDSNNPF